MAVDHGFELQREGAECPSRRRVVGDEIKTYCKYFFNPLSSPFSSFLQEGNGPYCSFNCKHLAGPDDEENNSAAIIAWASGIPLGPAGIPRGPPSPPPSPPVHSSSSSTYSFSSSACRPPQLLRPHRPVPPTLCMTTPTTAAPPSSTIPIQTSHKPLTCPSILSLSEFKSIGNVSVLSGATEASLATPASANPMPISASRNKSFIGSIASHVRSWVSPSPAFLFSSQQKTSQSPPRVDTAKFTVLSKKHHLSPLKSKSPSYDDDDDDNLPVCWMSSTVLVETNSAFNQPKHPRGRRRTSEHNDDHPSFRARGRKTSRAVD
ncbi:uncharacterized protein LACBIDRAFT_294788 [Laccaria bicolor S238N-H82]|uniref:Predicted protein n=1 Tax=Laccaria bicolor (strain S238N-H82 / ATCC MYA-4686) TaxID=486041 RepID=B0DI79_LACBS|nr:uncharacterized protein LACBIDRAFT_294788 [Laccaria bicolor S238N-H82]EDR05530.1 predicted protein [Laccaria bicolor S238N-H82]|eukprot:XP_001883634.1 predicted protein [Laccaria bicolor S238N-H82]